MQRLIKGNDFGFNNADGTLGDRDRRTVLGSSSRRCARRGRRLCCRYHKRTSLAGFIPCARKRIKQIGAKVKQNQSTRLNSSHVAISYAVLCLKKNKSITHA